MEQVQLNKATATLEAGRLVQSLQDLKQLVKSNQESLKLQRANTGSPSTPVDGPEPADSYANKVFDLCLKKLLQKRIQCLTVPIHNLHALKARARIKMVLKHLKESGLLKSAKRLQLF